MTDTSPNYTIHLPVFEGPLDLLLNLIEMAELDITSIALAQVTNQYLEYMHNTDRIQLDDLASFLVIAARLIQIKSEALLPRAPEREPGEEDPGEALARQLIVYKRFKEIAQLLEQRDDQGFHTYLRQAPLPYMEPVIDLSGATVDDLRAIMIDLLTREHDDQSLTQAIAPLRLTVKDRIESIVEELRTHGRTTFFQIVKSARSRVEIAVTFLAMLELIKQRQAIAIQEELFGEIQILPGDAWAEGQGVLFDLEFEE